MSLIRHHILSNNRPIEFVGVNWFPTSGGSNFSSPAAVVPPSGMIAADLVLMIGSVRAGAATLTVSATGGQTWTALTAAVSNQNTTRIFWCRYNGTWSANPSVATGSSGSKSCGMIVFRPSHPGKNWAVDVAISNVGYTPSGSTPQTITITGQTTTREKTVSITLTSQNSGTVFNAPSSTGWKRPTGGVHQYINNSDLSISPAYLIKAIQGATGNFVHDIMSTPPATNGVTSIVTFYEF